MAVETELSAEALQRQVAELEARLQQEIARHRTVEEQLRRSQEKYRLLVETMSEVLYVADVHGTLTYASPSVEVLLQYRPDEVVGRQMAQFIHPDDRDRAIRRLRQVLKRRAVTSEYRVLTRSGEIRWVRTSSKPIMDGEQVVGAQGVVADITEQQIARQQVLRQNEFLTSVLESLSHPFYVVDADDFTIQMANSAAREAGLKISGTCYSLTHGLSAPCGGQDHPCPVASIKQTGKAASVEHIHRGPDGAQRYVEIRGYPLFDDQGNVVRIIEYSLDITERRAIEEAHRKSEQRYLLLLEAMQEGVWVVDGQESTTFVTPRMAEMLGYGVGEIMDRSLYDFVDEGDVELCRRHVKGGRPDGTVPSVYRFQKKDGSRMYAQLEAAALADAQGDFLGAVVGIQDVTSRRQTELALRKSEALLRETQHLARLGGWELDLASGQLDWTEEIYRIYEVPPGFKPTLETALGFYDPRDRPALEAAMQRAMETGKPWDLELRLTTGQGRQRWVRAIGRADWQDSRVIRLSGTAQDITELRLTAEALQKATEDAEQARSQEQARRQESERRREIAERLAEVMAALNSNEPLVRLLAQIASEARELLGCQAVSIYRMDAGYANLEAETTLGIAEAQALDQHLPVVQKTLRRAMSERQALQVAGMDVAIPEPYVQSSLNPDRRRMAGNAPGSAARMTLTAVPIQVKDQVYGAMLLHHLEPHMTPPDGLEIAAAFANQAALALENAELREQARQAAVTAERQRLARELHDSVTQNLFTASLVAEVLPQVWRRDPEQAMDSLEKLRYLTRGALAEMRTMLLELRPGSLQDYKLQDLVRQLLEGVTGRAELSVTPCLQPVPSLPLDVHTAFFRIAQEALQNVVKHAQASQITVCLEALPPLSSGPGMDSPRLVRLEVRDNGLGFDPAAPPSAGLGLRIMNERAASINALLAVVSSPGQGTQITLVWPATEHDAAEAAHGSTVADKDTPKR